MGHWRLMRNAAHQRYSADHGQLGTSLPMLNLVAIVAIVAIVVKEYEPAIGFSSAPGVCQLVEDSLSWPAI